MKYLAMSKVHESIRYLRKWRTEVDSQGSLHLWTFLSSKWKGVKLEGLTEFGESDDFKFWNEFMSVGSGDTPYLDPLYGDRASNHPHSNVATSRKNRWPTWGVATWNQPPESWQFEPSYVQNLAEKITEKGGTVTKASLLHIVVWLYRVKPQSDDQTITDMVDKFKSEFNLTDLELEKLFDTPSSVDLNDADDSWFDTRRVSDDLIRNIASDPEAFSLDEALALLSETSDPPELTTDDVIEMLVQGGGQLVLQGPPGTGKTHLALQSVLSILSSATGEIGESFVPKQFLDDHQWSSMDLENRDTATAVWDIVQFHPGYAYEDFVRGIEATLEDGQVVFRAVHKILSELIEFLNKSDDHTAVLIIDEMNRADLSKVLGELIFALEYRDTAVRTPYTIDDSSLLRLTERLSIIGTMNTADRSIALIDYALRRRFSFLAVPPSRSTLSTFLVEHHSTQSTERILDLFDATTEHLRGNPDFLIGHTYFLKNSTRDIANSFVFKVLPLLLEYQREGILEQSIRIRPEGWPVSIGIPPDHPRPFDLTRQLSQWLDGEA